MMQNIFIERPYFEDLKDEDKNFINIDFLFLFF
jgi:hypothetical protein